MNKTAIRRVALALATGELATGRRHIGYNQTTWRGTGNGLEPPEDKSGHHCGTVACVAGTALALYDPKSFKGRANTAYKFAKRKFGLSSGQADRLFQGNPSSILLGHSPTAKQAALVLFNLAETGKVDWSIAKGL